MDYEENGCLHDMFRRQAQLTPDKMAAVAADGESLTYRQLDEVTDVVARYLQLRGVAMDSIVGIYMERCLNYVICYIAILKAGGAYMPIDVSYPLSLMENILMDSKPAAIFTELSMHKRTANAKDAQNVILCDQGWIERIRAELLEELKTTSVQPPKVTLDNLAYTVYSSGTTGKPKGIQCPHRGAVFSYTRRYQLHPYDCEEEREACNVFFVWEMLRPLLKGACLYVIPDNTIYDPRLLCTFLHEHRITRILFTPSLLEAVVDTEGLDLATSLPTLRTVVFCGEVVTVALLERCVNALPHVVFVNLYSISEAHDVASINLTNWYRQNKGGLGSRKFCPVGPVYQGVHVVIMDEHLQPQPIGVPGEIYIGGPTLARGYLNRPEMNAERFIQRPDSMNSKAGDRLYKAGDWGYLLSDGSFEICGRCDSMVKIRGYSIETQAVEAALLELVMVNACVVLSQGEEGQDKHLVAYIVPQASTTKSEVRAALKTRLPFYMIPSYFVFLNSIPILSSSGKLDKKALPPVDHTDHGVDEAGKPTTETEAKLLPLWAELLQIKSIDIHDSFFDLGGHSLLAARLLARIKEAFSVELSVRDLFIHSSICDMAKLLQLQCSTGSDSTAAAAVAAAATVAAAAALQPALDLRHEVEAHDHTVLSLDIQLRAFWRSMQYAGKWNKARVLLTGATGFLGAFLLRDLLLTTKTQVFCLVRELPEQKGMDRIKQHLTQMGILVGNGVEAAAASSSNQLREAKVDSRVTAIRGDVALVNMGLSEEDYTYLCTEIDFIIHAAAAVNLVYPYQALHGTNVLGTHNVIQFACTSKVKPLHYISTDAVFPHGRQDCGEDEDMGQHAAQLDDGYAQSKWVAEQLVRRAMDRGLPAVIYRLGNLSGESEQAHWNPVDFTLLMLQGCLWAGCAPQLDWAVEMTPVDFASSLIIMLTQQMGLVLGKVHHIINTEPIPSKWLFEWISAHGYPLRMLPWDQWLSEVKSSGSQLKKNEPLMRLLDGMLREESYFSRLSTYRRDNLDKVLGMVGLRYPEVNHMLLTTYMHHLAKRRLIPTVRRNTLLDRPLTGQVAIVTGASSGIGAAVSQHLARAGALVAMAARREEKLVNLKRNIEQEGGTAIAVKCDVTDRQDVRELVRHTECTLGPVDVLVNNAGVMYYTLMANLMEDQWLHQVDLNCKGVLNCVGAVLDGMISRGKGHIVNMSSDAGRRGFAGLAVYSGTKFFVEGLSQGLRLEMAQTGVKVTCIQPGDVKTELLSHSTDAQAKESYAASEGTKVLQPDDIGRAVVYAVTQPSYAAVNEILIEPRGAPI